MTIIKIIFVGIDKMKELTVSSVLKWKVSFRNYVINFIKLMKNTFGKNKTIIFIN